MDKLTQLILFTALTSGSGAALANDSGIAGSIAIDGVWGSTKIGTPNDGEIRRDEQTYPSFFFTLEHDIEYVPNLKFRYSNLETTYLSHDKFDYTFYWHSLRTEVLHLDVGVALNNYLNSEYVYSLEDDIRTEFESVIFSFYGYGEMHFPDTQLAMIGEFDFSNFSDVKTADVTAGLQYQLPTDSIDLILRGGYRVLDYTFKDLNEKRATGFVDGWFLGVKTAF